MEEQRVIARQRIAENIAAHVESRRQLEQARQEAIASSKNTTNSKQWRKEESKNSAFKSNADLATMNSTNYNPADTSATKGRLSNGPSRGINSTISPVKNMTTSPSVTYFNVPSSQKQ